MYILQACEATVDVRLPLKLVGRYLCCNVKMGRKPKSVSGHSITIHLLFTLTKHLVGCTDLIQRLSLQVL
jgi:hypothetical protein